MLESVAAFRFPSSRVLCLGLVALLPDSFLGFW